MAANDLTTLSKLREHLQILDVGDDSQDDLMESLITSVSVSVQHYCDREFKSTTGGTPTSRMFGYEGYGWLNLSPYDARSGFVTLVEWVSDDDTATTVDADAWMEWPIPAADGVVSYLRLPENNSRRVRVTATWGWAATPEPVERAVLVTIAYMMRTNSDFISNELPGVDAGNRGSGIMIPGMAKAMLDPYRRRSVGG